MKTGRTARRFVYIGVALGAATAVALASVAVATAAPEGEILSAGGPGAVPDRYMVVLKDTRANVDTAAANLADEYGAAVNHTYKHALRGFSAGMSEREAKRLAADPGVATVEQVHTVSVGGEQTNPPNYGVDRMDQRNLPLDKKFTYPDSAGEGTTVYVLDSGIRRTHQDFGTRASFGPDFVDGDNDSSDCHGHGTHVAGTAAGSTYGVAKKAKVVALRILNCQGSGGDDGIVRAIDWVKANAQKPAVVNYSVGCGQRCSSTTMDNAVKSLIASGVTWVQAAGNSSDDACYYSPQGVSEAITVGNTNGSDAKNNSSNYGRCLDIFAPGTSIISASYSSDTGTATMTGTSMSSPHTAGAVALYLGENRDATPAQVRAALVDNGTTGKVTSPGSGSPNVLLYTGFLNGGGPDPGDPEDPTARFTSDCPSGGLECSFDGTGSSDSDGSVTDYAWDFGDGSSGEGKASSHTYAREGSYTVTLTVTDDSGRTNATSAQVTVGGGGGGTAPTASFTANCAWQAPCAFDGSGSVDSDGSVTGYAWAFGDGATGFGRTASHAYPNRNGDYTATLTVTDNSGQTGSVAKQVNCFQGFFGNVPFCFIQ